MQCVKPVLLQTALWYLPLASNWRLFCASVSSLAHRAWPYHWSWASLILSMIGAMPYHCLMSSLWMQSKQVIPQVILQCSIFVFVRQCSVSFVDSQHSALHRTDCLQNSSQFEAQSQQGSYVHTPMKHMGMWNSTAPIHLNGTGELPKQTSHLYTKKVYWYAKDLTCPQNQLKSNK